METWNNIEVINSGRNKAIHVLDFGEITYDDIIQLVYAAEELISEL